MNGRHILGGFNQNQIREILQGFLDKIMYDIGGEREGGGAGGSLRGDGLHVGFLLGGPRCMHMSVICIYCHRYGHLHQQILIH